MNTNFNKTKREFDNLLGVVRHNEAKLRNVRGEEYKRCNGIWTRNANKAREKAKRLAKQLDDQSGLSQFSTTANRI